MQQILEIQVFVSQHGGAGNNDTRAVHSIGDQSDTSVRNILEYVTLLYWQYTDFGDLTVGRYPPAGYKF